MAGIVPDIIVRAEQGVAGLAHSPLHWIQSAVYCPRSPRSNEATPFARQGSLSVLLEGTTMNPAGKVRANMWKK
jgi:hypothetical protein